MAGKLTASFILKLEDQLSGGLSKIEKAFERLGLLAKKLDMGGIEDGTKKLDAGTAAAKKLSDAVDKIGSSSDRARTGLGRIEGANRTLDAGAQAAKDMAHSIDGIGRSAGKSAGELSRMARVRQSMHQINEHVGVLGGVAAGYAILEPIKAYAEQELTLRHIAITEKKSGGEMNPEISRLNTLFQEDALASGQSSKSIADAYSELVQIGIPAEVLDRVIGMHSKAATAYNISAADLGPAVGSLLQNFKIPEADIGTALAAMATASKEGRFKVTDFSRELPGIGGAMAALGMTGRSNADAAFAALEITMRNASNPGQAAANMQEGLSHIISKRGLDHFKSQNIDLLAEFEKGAKVGKNPLDVVMDIIKQKTKGMSQLRAEAFIKTIFPDQQSSAFYTALFEHEADYNKLRKELAGVTQVTADKDFASGYASWDTQVKLLNEELEQLNERLGRGFAPILLVVNRALRAVLDGFKWLDDKVPGLGDDVLVAVAALALLVAGLGVLGFVLPAIAAGFALVEAVLSPVLLLVAALAFAAYEIYENWDSVVPYFEALWEDVKKIFHGVVEFVTGVFTGDWRLARQGLEDAWDGIKGYYKDLWKGVEDVFTAFGKRIDDWTGNAWHDVINGFLAPFKEAESYIVNSALGRLMGLSGANPANPNSPQNGGGHEDGDGILAPNITPAGNATLTIGLDPRFAIIEKPAALPGLGFNYRPISPFGPVSPMGPTLSRP